MPYIITTWHNEDAAPTPVIPKPKDTRTAVATLDEARAYVGARASSDFTARTAIDGSGGSVGPLPDGTVIEVRPIGRHDLERMVGLEGHGIATVDRVIAAFNAK